MKDNLTVVPITAGKPAENEPDAETVELLEELLKMAKEGTLRGFVIAATMQDGATVNMGVSIEYPAAVNTALDALKQELLSLALGDMN